MSTVSGWKQEKLRGKVRAKVMSRLAQRVWGEDSHLPFGRCATTPRLRHGSISRPETLKDAIRVNAWNS